ncbi:MAG: O-antigen ligase domain-containing protein [Planctomycetota bacterium]|nr:MAG: O-antigen ligase domain-containing protein [Planctomycetota bacterium]
MGAPAQRGKAYHRLRRKKSLEPLPNQNPSQLHSLREEKKSMNNSTELLLERVVHALMWAFVVMGTVVRPFASNLSLDFGNLGIADQGSLKGLVLFINVLLGFSAVCLVLQKILLERFQLLRSGIDAPLLLLLAWATLSLLWSSHLYSSFTTLLSWLSIVLFFYVILHLSASGHASTLLHLLLATAFAVACMGLIDVFYLFPKLQNAFEKGKLPLPNNPQFLEDFKSRLYAKEAMGPFVTSNILGGFLLIFLWVNAGLIWQTLTLPPKKKKILRLATLTLLELCLLLCLYLTKSKGAWLAFLLGGALFALLIGRKTLFTSPKKIALTSLLVAAAALGILTIAALAFGLDSLQYSLETRLDYWKATLKMIRDHWLNGVGIYNFHVFYPAYKLPQATEVIRTAHNDYLQLFAELGIIGLLLYLWLLLKLFTQNLPPLSKKTTPNPSPTSASWKITLALTLVGALGFGMLYSFGKGIVADRGILLLLLPLWSIAFLFLQLTLPNETDPLPLQIGILTALGSFLLHSLGSFVLYSTGIFFVVFALIAILCGQNQPHLPAKKRFLLNFPLTTSRQITVVSAISLLVGLCVFVLHRSVRVDELVDNAMRLKNQALGSPNLTKQQRQQLLQAAQNQIALACKLFPLDENIPWRAAKISQLLFSAEYSPKNLQKVVEFYQLALSWAPRNYLIAFELGEFLEQFPQIDPQLQQAQQAYQQAVLAAPFHPKYHLALAKIYLKRSTLSSDTLLQAKEEVEQALYYNTIVPERFQISNTLIQDTLQQIHKKLLPPKPRKNKPKPLR